MHLGEFMLGHDLRGPMNAIHLSAEYLAANEERGEDELRLVNRIAKSCERSDRMVKDIIDFTRGLLGEPMNINRVPADLEAILREIIEEIQCGEPNVVIDFAASGDLAGEWTASASHNCSGIWSRTRFSMARPSR
jgi:signal transduction histidine kinase